MCNMRRNGLFFGVVIILAGALLLAINLGVIMTQAWTFFWPGLIILAGVWFLLRPTFYKNQTLEMAQSSIKLDGAARGEIEFHHGAGRLQVDASARAGELYTGTFTGGVTSDVRRSADGVNVVLNAPADLVFAGPWGMAGNHGFEWKVGVTPEVPVKLHFHTGASESILDLSGLKATDVVVETGASSTELTLPANAGFSNVKVNSGVASMKIRIPAGVGANIHVQSGLSDLKIDKSRFVQEGEYYRSPDYATAVNKVDLFVETGVGSVEIK
jgi:hypothetical protein